MADAVIIPFPAPLSALTLRAPRNAPDPKLQAALDHLHSALADQAKAVSEWRFAMAELGIGVAALRHSVTEYEGSLGQLDGRLGGLRDAARSLGATAEFGHQGSL